MYGGLRSSALLLLVACGTPPASGPSTEASSSPEASTAMAASSDASSGPSAVAPTASASTVAPASTAAPAPLELPAGALFVYREGDLTVSFTTPRRVTVLRPSDKPCSYELSDNGNMLSGAEVEAAWRKVQTLTGLAEISVFMAPNELLVSGEVLGTKKRIVWTAQCGGLCLPGPPDTVALLRTLHIVATNARGVCKL